MLVLISFGLVLVATVLLVIGLMADSGLGFIYVSIACSLAAGIILVVATRVNRPRAEAASTGPAPLPPPEAPIETPAAAATTAVAAVPAAPSDEEFAPTPSVPAAAAAVDDDLFPIADYDDLSLGEILPLLPKLYADELDVVEAREKAGKSRRQIISRLGELRESMEGAPDDLTAEEWEAQRPAAATRAPARKAPAKKVVAAAPAKKATPTKKAAAPTKKVAAATKKAAAPAKKAAAATKKATPAKKAAAPAKKAATKTAAKKAAAPAKKVAKKATKATKK
ncbi:MAG TPA: hypothetical protein VFU93_12320 [Acidimicrobiales bacterium]|nr:hypothetical protein [Acidimicrobiales bacterium]